MTEETVQPQELEIRLSVPGQLRVVAMIGLFLLAYVVLWATGVIEEWIAVLGVVVFGGVFAIGLLGAVRSSRWAPVARLGPRGITVPGHETVPWTDLREVVVTGMQPSWFFVLGRRRSPVVAFVPRAGVRLPALQPPGGRGRADRLRGVRERLYGTSLLFMPHAMTASVEQLTSAAHAWGHLPVRGRRS